MIIYFDFEKKYNCSKISFILLHIKLFIQFLLIECLHVFIFHKLIKWILFKFIYSLANHKCHSKEIELLSIFIIIFANISRVFSIFIFFTQQFQFKLSFLLCHSQNDICKILSICLIFNLCLIKLFN